MLRSLFFLKIFTESHDTKQTRIALLVTQQLKPTHFSNVSFQSNLNAPDRLMELTGNNRDDVVGCYSEQHFRMPSKVLDALVPPPCHLKCSPLSLPSAQTPLPPCCLCPPGPSWVAQTLLRGCLLSSGLCGAPSSAMPCAPALLPWAAASYW